MVGVGMCARVRVPEYAFQGFDVFLEVLQHGQRLSEFGRCEVFRVFDHLIESIIMLAHWIPPVC